MKEMMDLGEKRKKKKKKKKKKTHTELEKILLLGETLALTDRMITLLGVSKHK